MVSVTSIRLPKAPTPSTTHARASLEPLPPRSIAAYGGLGEGKIQARSWSGNPAGKEQAFAQSSAHSSLGRTFTNYSPSAGAPKQTFHFS